VRGRDVGNYSDQRRAEALAALDANGGNLSKTSRDTGIPRQTLQEWRDGRVPEGVPELRQEKKAALADRLEELAHTIVDALPGKVADAGLQQAATSLAIAIDKMQLLRGEATAIHGNRDLTEDERADRLAALLEQGEKRAGLPAPDAGRTGRGRPAPNGAVH
jgi:transposase-like protein